MSVFDFNNSEDLNRGNYYAKRYPDYANNASESYQEEHRKFLTGS